MGNLKKSKSLGLVLISYIVAALAAAFMCCIIILRFFENWKYIVLTSNDFYSAHYSNGIILIFDRRLLDKKTAMEIGFLSRLELISIILCIIVSVIVLSLLFYKRKLEHPFYILKREALCIGRNDLSFDCSYVSGDEMDEICHAFNLMRLRLEKNQKKLWQMMEEQRKLNAAFAHDIRTPVTVIRGYAQMLTKFQGTDVSSEKQMEILNTIIKQTDRIEKFSMTMNKIHSLNERSVEIKEINLSDLVNQLKYIAEGIKGSDILIDMQYTGSDVKLYCDVNIIQEVADNLLSNALRYANKHILVALEADGGYLYLYIKDDGQGIGKKLQYELSRPYFTTEKDHFGMGLTICKTLCRKCGGDIELVNSIDGGTVATARFKCEKDIL